MEKREVVEIVVEIFARIVPHALAIEENLFGTQNNCAPRDVAYALLEIEREFHIDIANLVKEVDNTTEGFAIRTIANAIELQMSCGNHA